jgi:hypothetical protein
MSSNICAVGNHQLDTTSIEALAADIAQRMKVRVQYGTEQNFTDFVVLGERGEGTRTLRLCDLREQDEAANVVVYELYDEPGKGEYNVYIYQDCFRADAEYVSEQFSIFCSNYTGKYKGWESVLQYRKDVYVEVLLLGGNTAIYYADQGVADFVSYDAETTPFATLLHKVKAMKKAVELSAWLRSFSGNFLTAEPVAFVDDFSYWPDITDITSKYQ